MGKRKTMALTFGHIELFVRDPMHSAVFYRDVLGASIVAIQNATFVWLAIGGTEILLRPGTPLPAGDEYGKARAAFVLYTDNLDTMKAALEKRGLIFCGTDSSDNCLTCTDDDGNWFQIVNPSTH